MRTQTLWLSFAAMCLLGRSVRAEDGAAARRLLQMDFGGLLGGGGSNGCLSKGSLLVNGPCSPFVQAFKANADSIVNADEATFARAVAAAPKPQAQCCIDATAFVTSGCSCDSSVLDFAPYMGLNANGLVTIARAATIVCSIPSNPCVPAPANPTPASVPSPVATQAAASVQQPVPATQPIPAANQPVASAPLQAAGLTSTSVPVQAPLLQPHVLTSPSQAPAVASIAASPARAPAETVPASSQTQVTHIQPVALGQPQPLQRPGGASAESATPQGTRPYYEFQIPTTNTGNRVVSWDTRRSGATLG